MALTELKHKIKQKNSKIEFQGENDNKTEK